MNLIYLLPEFIILLGLTYIIFESYSLKSNLYNFTIFILLLSIAILFILIADQNTSIFLLNKNILIYNQFDLFIKTFLYAMTMIIVILSYFYLGIKGINYNDFCSLILISLVGMSLIISSNDLITLYLNIELQSLSFYVLTTIKKNSNFSTEAGLKYFILGSLASSLMLFGFSFIYGIFGTTNLTEISLLINIQNYSVEIFFTFLISLIFVLSGLLFKLSAAPFHSWAPDVYYGAPTIITALFALVSKISILTILIKLTIVFYYYSTYWSSILIICSILSLIIGSFTALYQTKIKRFLAYSTISHIGFILMSLFCNVFDGYKISLFYLFVYITITLGLFLILLSTKDYMNFELDSLKDFVNVYINNRTIGIIFTIILFSIAGIPPFIGFFSKFLVLWLAIANNFYFYGILAVTVSAVSCVYYIRLVKIMFFDYLINTNKDSCINYNFISLTLSLVVIINVFFFFYGSFFLEFISKLTL